MANFNLNKVILGGRLASVPELRQTPSGVMVTSFTIAVNRRFVPRGDDGQRAESQADFIRVTAWRQSAEFVSKYFTKGSSICVVGSIQTRSWTDAQGNKQYSTDVVADEINFVDSKGEGPLAQQNGGGYMPSAYNEPMYSTPAGQAPASQSGAAPQFETLEDDEDLPF